MKNFPIFLSLIVTLGSQPASGQTIQEMIESVFTDVETQNLVKAGKWDQAYTRGEALYQEHPEDQDLKFARTYLMLSRSDLGEYYKSLAEIEKSQPFDYRTFMLLSSYMVAAGSPGLGRIFLATAYVLKMKKPTTEAEVYGASLVDWLEIRKKLSGGSVHLGFYNCLQDMATGTFVGPTLAGTGNRPKFIQNDLKFSDDLSGYMMSGLVSVKERNILLFRLISISISEGKFLDYVYEVYYE